MLIGFLLKPLYIVFFLKNVFYTLYFILDIIDVILTFVIASALIILFNPVKTLDRNAFILSIKNKQSKKTTKPFLQCFITITIRFWNPASITSLSYYRYVYFERFKEKWFSLQTAFGYLDISTPFSYRSLSKGP